MAWCALTFIGILACVVFGAINPALDFYPVGEQGELQGVPFSSLVNRITNEFPIGDPMQMYPCTAEPYYLRLNLKHAHHDMDLSVVPYNTPFEGYWGDFLSIYGP